MADNHSVAATDAAFYPAMYYVNFRGPARTYPLVPYYRIIRREIEPSWLRGKIVLVGALTPSLHDLYPTPYSASHPTAGVEIQANIVETLAANDPIRPFSGWRYGVLFALLAAMTVSSVRLVKPLWAFAMMVGLSGIVSVVALWLFAHEQLWLPLVPSLLGVMVQYGGMTLDNYVREQREHIRLRATFGRYVSPDVVEEILENREGLALGGKRRHITVLFSDIRGFTSISERIDPEQVVAFLSEFLAQATAIVFKHGGTVDKFMGDAVMAMFGAPRPHDDDALRAVRAGVEIIHMVDLLSPQWSTNLGGPLKVGVGIISGDAVVGSIGSEIRSDFTAIGDVVNLAARLEGLTKELGTPLLLSEFTAVEVNEQIPLQPLQHVRVVGREAPLLIYTVQELYGGTGEVGAHPAEPYIQQHK